MGIIINGWLHEDERLALRRWCFQKDVLELGAFEGLSSCNIAMTARSLVTVDTFDGRGTAEHRDTAEAFWKNINSIDRAATVRAHRGMFSEVLPTLAETFDCIFIDGSHDYESVMQDVELSLPHLRPGGLLLMHDYCIENPGVVKAVDELIAAKRLYPRDQANSLIMLATEPAPEKKTPKVVIGMPHRDGWAHYGAVFAATAIPSTKYTRWTINQGNSILTLTFNQLLADALNLRDKEGATHFAMLHNDIVPCANWLDILMDELVAHNLDMISAVVPIKNEKGLTSTASDNLGYPWGVRRLTMKEVMALPETFTVRDIPHRQDDACLLLNSGCTLMKIDEPWMEGLHFRQQDRIAWCVKDQEWVAQGISEDWDLSRQLVARGCRLGATRKVGLFHFLPQYNNSTPWGTYDVDEDFITAEAETAHLKNQEQEAMSRQEQQKQDDLALVASMMAGGVDA